MADWFAASSGSLIVKTPTVDSCPPHYLPRKIRDDYFSLSSPLLPSRSSQNIDKSFSEEVTSPGEPPKELHARIPKRVFKGKKFGSEVQTFFNSKSPRKESVEEKENTSPKSNSRARKESEPGGRKESESGVRTCMERENVKVSHATVNKPDKAVHFLLNTSSSSSTSFSSSSPSSSPSPKFKKKYQMKPELQAGSCPPVAFSTYQSVVTKYFKAKRIVKRLVRNYRVKEKQNSFADFKKQADVLCESVESYNNPPNDLSSRQVEHPLNGQSLFGIELIQKISTTISEPSLRPTVFQVPTDSSPDSILRIM